MFPRNLFRPTTLTHPLTKQPGNKLPWGHWVEGVRPLFWKSGHKAAMTGPTRAWAVSDSKPLFKNPNTSNNPPLPTNEQLN